MIATPRTTPHVRALLLVVPFVLIATTSEAVFLTPAQKCQLDKQKTAAKYGFCLMKAVSKAFKKDIETDFTRCDQKFELKWAKVETKAIAKGLPCLTQGDLETMQARILDDVTGVAEALTGTRFLDHEDGTVSDLQTGLMWEQKVAGGGCLHCTESFSPWHDLAEWLSEVNGYTDDPEHQSGLGGYSDWRLPTVAELQTLLLQPAPCPISPCIAPIFGPAPTMPAVPFRYWSSTTSVALPTAAWFIDFADGSLGVGGKAGSGIHVRAVRGSL